MGKAPKELNLDGTFVVRGGFSACLSKISRSSVVGEAGGDAKGLFKSGCNIVSMERVTTFSLIFLIRCLEL